MHQRGTSLLEVVLVVAILVSITIAFWSQSQGARAFGMQSAASQFDGALAYAHALASNSGNGATLVFDRRSSGDGTEAAGFVLTI